MKSVPTPKSVGTFLFKKRVSRSVHDTLFTLVRRAGFYQNSFLQKGRDPASATSTQAKLSSCIPLLAFKSRRT
jgi:hypothetical protein